MLFLRFRLLFGVVVTLTTLYLLYLGHYKNFNAFLGHSQVSILTFGATFFGILGFRMVRLSQGLCCNTFNNGIDSSHMARLTPCVVSYLVASLTVSIAVGLFVQLLPEILNWIRKFRKWTQK